MTKPSLNQTKAEDLTQILPHSPLLTSLGAEWNNIFLAYYHQHPGCEIHEFTIPQHTLEVIDANSWSHHERRMGKTHLSYRIGGGEACLCPAHTSHWTTWDEPLSFTVLAFEPAFFEQVAQEVVNRSTEGVLGDRLEFIPKWQVFDPMIQNIATALRSDLEAGCPAGRLYGESFGTALAVYLLRHFSSAELKIPEYAKGLPKSSLKQIVDFIENHLDTDIRLDDLANTVGISAFHFCRLFKQTMHLTPHQYVIRRRVELAKRLLKQSELRIVDVALLCGFANQSHLSRHFRRLVGMSPKTFRNH